MQTPVVLVRLIQYAYFKTSFCAWVTILQSISYGSQTLSLTPDMFLHVSRIRAWKSHLKIETENIWSISAYPLLFADTIQHRLRVLCTHTFFIFYIFVKNIFYLILPDVYNFTRMRRVRGLIYGIMWTLIFGTKRIP